MDGNEKRVLQFVYLTHDGITSMIFNICEFMDREKVNFDYLAFAKGEAYAYEKIEKLGGRPVIVDVDDIPNPFVRSIRKYYGIYRMVQAYQYEIIHINASTPYDILIGAAARMGGAKRVIFHSHNSKGDKRFRRDILIPFCRLLVPFIATDYIACSDLAAKYMFPRFIYQKKAYTLLHNGIDVDRFAYDQAERDRIRESLGIGNCLVFGNIGRFHPQKNHFFLLKIFAAILKRKSDARLLLVGTGELEEALKEEADRLLIKDRVIFYGTTSEIPQMLWAMDAYLMPSVYEGLPVTGVEAQAAGLPMLVSGSVSRELRLTKLVHYMSLKRPAKEWAAAAVALAERGREDCREELRKKGYDIRDIAKEVGEIYES
ncbi:MAG: glycosyltransferase [Eubacteriales bacterium]|nr:glycosyltransferase [Eubacteriales bacterium]